ncbi:MAG: protein arginine kinase [Phycisphaerae bacterium]|nr:protein arginine kinase [Phycisphaerae bacterium]
MTAPGRKSSAPFEGDTDVVLSSRVRLARNLSAFPFVNRASHAQRREVVDTVRSVPLCTPSAPKVSWMDMGELATRDRQLLVERHLVSRQFIEGDSPRALAVAPDETLAIMVNEEDHLRLQSMQSGSDLATAYENAMALDDALSAHLDFAYSATLGYLTACPTNVGCGIRLSVMVNMRALRLSHEIERVQRAAKDLHLAVRGFYGEGSEAIGDWFQISNQRTLGVREEDLVADFTQRIVPTVVAYEREARRLMLERSRTAVEDRVYRAMAVLRTARLMTMEEAMKHLSAVRMGVCLGLIQDVTLAKLNALTVDLQPAHLRAAHPTVDSDEAEREARARAARLSLGEIRL